MGFRQKATAVVAKLKLGKHHKAERLLINTAALIVSGVLVFGAAASSAVQANIGTLGSQAVYTEEFASSKTATQGKVEGVFRSPDGARSLLVMSLLEPERASINAKDYQAFLTGASTSQAQEALKTEGITGEIIVFGTTGYMGVLLDTEDGFQTQIVDLVIRANSELEYKPGEAELSEDMEGDASFVEFDQWRVFFNPGASKSKPIEALGKTTLDMGDLFYETVLVNQEAEVRGQLDAKLMEMRAALARIENERGKIATTNVAGETRLIEPDAPVEIRDDEVIGEPGTKSESDKAKEEAEAAGEAPAEEPTDTGSAEIEGTGDDSTLELATDFTVPGGYDFDWRGGSVQEGYAVALTEDGESLVDMLQRHADEAQADGGQFDTSGVKWMTTGGIDLGTYESSRDGTLKPLQSIVENLKKNWSDYYYLKREYQIEMPVLLLQLELELLTAQTSTTTNSGEDVILTY